MSKNRFKIGEILWLYIKVQCIIAIAHTIKIESLFGIYSKVLRPSRFTILLVLTSTQDTKYPVQVIKFLQVLCTTESFSFLHLLHLFNAKLIVFLVCFVLDRMKQIDLTIPYLYSSRSLQY